VVAAHADWLGVNAVDEALVLARLGIARPVCILGFTPPEDAAAVVAHGFRQVVYRDDVAVALSRAAAAAGTPARIHVKIETGTNRQGVTLADLPAFLERIRALPGLEIDGVSSHFANIEDTLDPAFPQAQQRRFEEAMRILAAAGVRPPHVHTAATAGVLLFPETHFTMVRVGVGVYGIWPSRETRLAARERGRQIPLEPPLTWKCRIAQIKHVDRGEYVGYGLTFQAPRPLRLAVLPVGYYDGYDRRLSNAGRVLVRGRYAAVVGRVAMNMTMADVTDTGADVSDEVVLLGRQGDAEIRADELAEKIGTIPYEVVARLNPRIPRTLV
jgi:alanine racemase